MKQPATFWNLPNTITVVRMALVPVMVWLLWDEPRRGECIAAFCVFVGAMLSDILDGYLARKWNLVSPAGAYLDPLADKLMVATTLIMLIPLGWAPAWLVALIICRESAITGLRGIASQEGMVISASTLGKLKTAYQSTAIGFILWHVDITWFEGGPVLHTANAGLVLLYLGTLFSLLSAAEYLIQFFRLSAAVVRERAQSGS